ncbi:cell wall anchor protein [Chryseobacterium sp. LAM-KRS1]|uniref:cell wall anchor protein n=1 Tax=Chryseobacterium sp. LAM-KRS1 TaxID=2715754 RepID=UPI001624A847|nr:cell wall anchor protein [Chryseobacterium sp. LAM-KRS1]
MKKSLLIGIILFTQLHFAQQAANLQVQDTRNVNPLPSEYNREFKAEFKDRAIIEAPGAGKFSGLLTIAPWSGNSGNKNHQINFNDGGVFYRNALPNDPKWSKWGKFLIESSEGTVAIGGPTDPNIAFKNYGRAQFYTNINSDGVQVRSTVQNVSSGMDLMWLVYDHYQSNDVGLLTLSSPHTQGDWAKYVFTVRANGKVLIGTSWNNTALSACNDCNEYRLFVKDGIKTEKVKIEVPSTNGWADYVFGKDYHLRSLEEVEKHIEQKGHLPNIPSAEEVVKNGINVGEMDAKLLEKIEELTLYSIEQNKQLKFQSEKIKQLEKLLKSLFSGKIK